MSSLFMKSGSAFFPTNDANLDIHKKLPPGSYLVCFNPMKGYYFEVQESFTMPKKIYGDPTARAERVINTFHDRPNSTGVILAGEKGSGKTLLAKMISLKLAEEGIITLIVNQPYHGDSFNQLIQSVNQPAYVFFDEFEKVYNDQDAQNALLTLFDGLFSSKKLFAVTTNDKYKINEFMLNRPGRFFYAFKYAGVDLQFIREYLEDVLINKDNIESFVRYASTFDNFNFDMLQALAEEMNRYSENVLESVEYVNITQSWGSKFLYEVKSFHPKAPLDNFKEVKTDFAGGRSINPFTDNVYLSYDYTVVDEKDPSENWTDSKHIQFTPLQIKKYDNDGTLVYENDEAVVVVGRKAVEKFDIRGLM